MEPRLEASVIEPFWKKTRSPSSTAIARPAGAAKVDGRDDELAIFRLVLEVGHGAIREMRTPCASSQFSGRTRESYWL